MYAGTCDQGNLPVTASPSVTAGLMWLPEMWPRAYTVATRIVPNAKEIMPTAAIVNGALPFTMRVAGTDPTPTNTRNAVPMTSAVSFWARRGSSMSTSAIERHSTMSNLTGKLRPQETLGKPAMRRPGKGAKRDDPVGRPGPAHPHRPAGRAPDEPG